MFSYLLFIELTLLEEEYICVMMDDKIINYDQFK